MAVNRYCVVMIQGTKMNPHTRRSEPAFMLDPHVTFPNPDVDPRALDMVRERAAVVRARLRGTDPDDETVTDTDDETVELGQARAHAAQVGPQGSAQGQRQRGGHEAFPDHQTQHVLGIGGRQAPNHHAQPHERLFFGGAALGSARTRHECGPGPDLCDLHGCRGTRYRGLPRAGAFFTLRPVLGAAVPTLNPARSRAFFENPTCPCVPITAVL